MLLRKSFKFRLYPTEAQEKAFRQTAGATRFLYNLCLEQRRLEWHRSDPRRLTAYDQMKELAALKVELPWLSESPHHALQQAIRDLDQAFRNFFEGRADYPAFHKRGRADSFRYPDPKQFKLTKGRIFLPKMGWVDWVQHRSLEHPGQTGPVQIKTCTIIREADGWFAAISCEFDVAAPAAHTAGPVGIDIGVTKPMMLMTPPDADGVFPPGIVIDLPKITPRERARLAIMQARAARRKPGSRNRAKALRAVARRQAYFARRRKDAAHKATTKIARAYSFVVVEDLRVRNMTASARGTVEEPGRNIRQKSGLNRAILDVAPFQIRTMLAYKTIWNGGELRAVPAPYTSQECRRCGFTHPGNRTTQANFLCLSCDAAANADENSGSIILVAGLRCRSVNRVDLIVRKQKKSGREAGSPVIYGGE
jgi:putative transposase